MADAETIEEVEVKTAIARQIETVTRERDNFEKWFALEPQRSGDVQRSPPGGPTYESLGIRPLINCKGTYTIISGSLMLPEVRAAMAQASQQYVQMEELQFAAGARISQLMQSEWALVTCGCSAALLQITAACMAGVDPAMGDEVIFLQAALLCSRYLCLRVISDCYFAVQLNHFMPAFL
jgi:hypothetical protein